MFAQRYLLADFKTCIAVAKGGIPIQERFNYNCVTQTMEFMSGEDILRLDPISQIDTLYLEGHKMIPYGTRFLEVLYQSPEFSLLIDHKRKMKEDGKIGAMGIKTQNGVQNVTTAPWALITAKAGKEVWISIPIKMKLLIG